MVSDRAENWQTGVFDYAEYESCIILALNSTDQPIVMDHWAFIDFVRSDPCQVQLKIGRHGYDADHEYGEILSELLIDIDWKIIEIVS